MSTVPSETPIGSDVCQCGDYRSQHNYGSNSACRVCGNMSGPYNGCQKFRFGRMAGQSELEHWRLYHGRESEASR
jgi:hypothetical protein